MSLQVSSVLITPSRQSCVLAFTDSHCDPRKNCSHELIIESVSGELAPVADGLFALCLPMAMRVGGRLKFEEKITKSLSNNLVSIIDWLRVFDKSLMTVEIEILGTLDDKRGDKTQVASFFSGGLDSTYTSLKKNPQFLISVHGFDISFKNKYLWSQALMRINSFAIDIDSEVIELRTNVREISDVFLGWGAVYHGAALGAIALVLPMSISQIYIPSTSALLASKPGSLGTGSEFCSLFSNFGRFTITDREISRLRKVYDLRESDALIGIRVCWENLEGKYQCGKCFKCTLTALEFEYSGMDEYPSGIDKSASVPQILKLSPSISQRDFLIEDYREARLLGLTHNLSASKKTAVLAICTKSLVYYFVKIVLKKLGLSKKMFQRLRTSLR